jgi:hypothetical protein
MPHPNYISSTCPSILLLTHYTYYTLYILLLTHYTYYYTLYTLYILLYTPIHYYTLYIPGG